MAEAPESRRRFFAAAGIAGAGLLLAASGLGVAAAADEAEKGGTEKRVGAVEDLNARARRAATRLARPRRVRPEAPRHPAKLSADAIARAARLFRRFGKNYHERMLEEAHVFPAVKKAGGPAAALVDTLIHQHDRGRDITGYVLSVTRKGTTVVSGGNDAPCFSRY